MENQDILILKKKVKSLTINLYLITTATICFFLFSFISTKNETFNEITAKKLTIVESNGQPRLVLANSQNSPANLMHGKTYGLKEGGRPGLIFLNDELTECGGLVFTGRKDPKTGEYFASGHFSFDQYDQNQVLYLQYLDDNGSKKTGLYVDDWHKNPDFAEFRKKYKEAEKIPDEIEREKRLEEMRFPKNSEPAFANRVFIGKDVNKDAVLNLSDTKGNVRLQMKVDSLGKAQILFLDDKGKITAKFPQQ
ncbi:hypothetical protein FEDK69T_30980 [Flavobacterium enshiense DK69]|uniref:Uncharacterized protein n=1 Tax=Flavobacterium enshiense DK69 TaxID=1107311 RepID=V6S0P7_9FLAO|nr:hypothetical protein [Flavobacterium enshiense]ESU19842.1 hypothetical protein FEDK69T_30980 [Flavobacterium enshiense DK69]KGO91911.1 hypothetical protein Q767_15840 [Flavobacterium enshiense DK69]